MTSAQIDASITVDDATPLRSSIWMKLLMVLGPFVVLIALRPLLPEWAIVWPEAWAVPFVDWVNAVVAVLKDDKIFIFFTFRDLTRAIAGMVEWPLDFLQALLISGFKSFGIPPLPWVMIVGLAAVLGWWIKGWRYALLAGGCIFYIALFGKFFGGPKHLSR